MITDMAVLKSVKNPEIYGTPTLHCLRQFAKNAFNGKSPLRYANFETYFGTLKTRITKMDECPCYECGIECDVLDFDDNIIGKVLIHVNTALANVSGSKGSIKILG